MSSEAVGWTFRHSPYTGALLAIHLAIADSVNDQHDNQFWMSQTSLSVKARIDRRTVQRSVPTLVSDGFLDVLDDSAGHTILYRFVFREDAEVVYESRRRGGVRQDVAPRTGANNPGRPGSDVAPPAASRGTGGDTAPHEPKRTQREPNGRRSRESNGPPPPTEDIASRLRQERERIDAEAPTLDEVRARRAEQRKRDTG